MQIAELAVAGAVVFMAIMMLTFAVAVSKRIRGRNHRAIGDGCIMGGARTASFVSAAYFISASIS